MRACIASLVLLASAPALADLRAEQITAETAAELDVGGPDAIGGVGDWWLSNGVVEAVVDDVSRAHATSNHGGTLVDLGLAALEDEDQFARLMPLVNLSQRVVAGYDAVRAELDPAAGVAQIVVTSSGIETIPAGSWPGLDPLVPLSEKLADVELETVYELRRGESFLRIVTTLHNAGGRAAPLFAFGDLWMRGGRSGRGFMGNSLDPEASRGFAARSTGTSLGSARGAMAAFTRLGLVGSADFPAIAYGYSSPERLERGMPLYGMMQEHASLALAFVGDPDAAGWSTWGLLRRWWDGLGPGEYWRFERRISVSQRWGGAPAPSGVRVSAPLPGRRGVVRFEMAGGATASFCRIDALHGCAVGLPPGDYVAALRAEHAPERRRPFRVEADAFAELDFEALGPPARLHFPQAFADGGPGRVELRGIGGTPDPVFGDDLLDATLDGLPMPSGTASSALVFAGVASDPHELALPPGRYRLTATRGLDWEIATHELEVGEGAVVEVPPFALEPLPALRGWVRGDLHVHAEASDDSQATNADRLRRFAAEGVEVLVATDHDHVAHYAPDLTRLGLVGRVRVVTGVEVTSSTPSAAAPTTLGHHNAWPVGYQPDAHRGGAPESQNRRIDQLYTDLRRHGVRVIQVNHPRAGLAAGSAGAAGHYFDHLGVGRPLDPTRPDTAPPGALDFDLIEVMNGTSWDKYLATRADWLALLRAGLRRSATANSDSHAPDELVAYPRNYVFVGADGDSPERFDAALRAGRSYGTTGPRLHRFTVNGAGLGETAQSDDGRVTVEYAVDAASWVPLDEVRVLVDGAVVHTSGEREGSLDLVLLGDAFLHLEAGAPLEVDPVSWAAAHPGPYSEVLAPGFVSALFTNPVFVEVSSRKPADTSRPPRSQP